MTSEHLSQSGEPEATSHSGKFDLRLERQRIAAIAANDVATMRQLFADDLLYVHSNGRIDSCDSYLAALETGGLRYGAVKSTEGRVVRSSGELGVAFSRLKFEANLNGQIIHADVHVVATWIRQGDRWRVAVLQSSPAPI